MVKHEKQLPAKHGGKRTRQIDVLLKGHFAGYPTMFIIECKNYSWPVNVGDLGRFRGLLEDVGRSPQQGVPVSAGSVGLTCSPKTDLATMRVLLPQTAGSA